MHRPISMVNRSVVHQLLALAGWLALTLATGAVGAIASVEAAEFYRQLSRPSWAPPGWLFGPVWTALYLMMGFSAWLVWRERKRRDTAVALGLFVAQLAVNALWSWIFFAWRRGGLAFAEILVLLALITTTLWAFWRIRRPAGVLLLPYLAWVCFATALTWSVWQANPSLLR